MEKRNLLEERARQLVIVNNKIAFLSYFLQHRALIETMNDNELGGALWRVEHLEELLPQPNMAVVVKMRYGLIDGEKKTFVQIGQDLNLSAAKVRDIFERARKILFQDASIEYLYRGHVDDVAIKLFKSEDYKKINRKTSISSFVGDLEAQISGSGIAIEDLDLCVREFNLLKRARVDTVQDLLKKLNENEGASILKLLGERGLQRVLSRLKVFINDSGVSCD